ncbi:MAG: beta-N-acetylhexosaminidase [Proteobacteria bacterium]|nr:MAG: beta-N-acetylhexosaminidase [Pseudomonadota bacterium]
MHNQLMIGLQGLTLSTQERQWLQDKPPLGVILFARNIKSPEQVTALLAEVRQCTGQATWAAIDEEGGRVNRMPWAPFTGRKHAAEYGRMFMLDAEKAKQAVFDDACKVAQALNDMGFTHNCAPVLDLFFDTGHSIIGQRSYAGDKQVVVALAGACMQGMLAAGIQAVGKHFPGHGRANADSHVSVPRVDASLVTLLAEAEVFEMLVMQGMAHMMTAHVVYTAADNQVATFSRFWLQDILRQRFAFDKNIWSDDLCMQGAGGSINEAVAAAKDAGCDVLLVCEPEGVEALYAE